MVCALQRAIVATVAIRVTDQKYKMAPLYESVSVAVCQFHTKHAKQAQSLLCTI